MLHNENQKAKLTKPLTKVDVNEGSGKNRSNVAIFTLTLNHVCTCVTWPRGWWQGRSWWVRRAGLTSDSGSRLPSRRQYLHSTGSEGSHSAWRREEKREPSLNLHDSFQMHWGETNGTNRLKDDLYIPVLVSREIDIVFLCSYWCKLWFNSAGLTLKLDANCWCFQRNN